MGLDFKWWVPCCSTILICVIFHSLFFYDLNFLFRWETLIDFCSPLKKFFFFFSFLKFEIFFEKWYPLFLTILENLFFLPSKLKFFWNWYHLSLKSFLFFLFFFISSLFFFFFNYFFWVSWLSQLNQTWVDLATQVY